MSDKNLQKEVISIQDRSLKSLFKVENFNQMMQFQINFQSSFIPILEYIVENGEENQIAESMNFGYFISELTNYKLFELFSTDFDKNEYIKLKIEDEEAFQRIKDMVSNKSAKFFSLLLSDLSVLAYNLILIEGIEKFDVLNYLIATANISNSILRAPLLTDITIEEEDLNKIIKRIEECQEIVSERGGVWDMTFSGKKDYPSSIIYEDSNRYSNVRKYPLCSKYSYLKAKAGINLALYIKKGDDTYLEDAIKSQNTLINCLSMSDSFHSELDTDDIIRSFKISSSLCYEDYLYKCSSIKPVTTHKVLAECDNNKKRYLEVIPNLGFYLSDSQLAKPELIYKFYKNTSDAIFGLGLHSQAKNSQLYKQEVNNLERIIKISRDKSLQILAEMTFGHITSSLGSFFEKAKPIDKSINVVFGVAAFYGSESTISLLNLNSTEYKNIIQIVSSILATKLYDSPALDNKAASKIKDMKLFYTPKNTDLKTYIESNKKQFFNDLESVTNSFGLGDFYDVNLKIKSILIDSDCDINKKIELLMSLLNDESNPA